MASLDTIAGLAVGGFLVSVALHGNSDALIAQAKKDRAFIKWAIAVGIAAYAYKLPGAAAPVTLIITAAFLAMFLKNGTQIAEQADLFWKSLSGALP